MSIAKAGTPQLACRSQTHMTGHFVPIAGAGGGTGKDPGWRGGAEMSQELRLPQARHRTVPGAFERPSRTFSRRNHDTNQIAKVVKIAMRGSKPGERRGGRQRGTPNKATVAKNAALKAASADPAIMPLQFLLGVMRDPKAPTDLRIQVARAAAPLVHGKLGTASPGNSLGRVGAVGCEGFSIDIEEAKALRNIQRRLGTLLRKRCGQNGGPF